MYIILFLVIPNIEKDIYQIEQKRSTSKENDVGKKQCVADISDTLNKMHEFSDGDDSVRDKDYIPSSDSSESVDSVNNGKNV